MKITALLVLKCDPRSEGSDPVILANATDVNHFGYFQRVTVRQFIVFVGRTVAKRTPPDQRHSVQHEEYKVHSYNRNGLCVVGFMDDHYPVRSAFSVLNKVIDEYQKSFGDSWRSIQADSTQPWPYLNDALTKFQFCILFFSFKLHQFHYEYELIANHHNLFSDFQDPAEADKLLKIQRELDETKIILHKTIDSVLERGEKLDSLVEKSSDLSAASQYFVSIRLGLHHILFAVVVEDLQCYCYGSLGNFIPVFSDKLQLNIIPKMHLRLAASTCKKLRLLGGKD
ncbi:synaptobrevin-like protein [Artemisia annua]|uniref:Synaptobrevin-like protein n=1 Tax=Artemisia annua TaxID=35608 RepID=A0A2U1LGQ2_ARTAN|nr:synaptobrevin-like protein [Artemisia annua]